MIYPQSKQAYFLKTVLLSLCLFFSCSLIAQEKKSRSDKEKPVLTYLDQFDTLQNDLKKAQKEKDFELLYHTYNSLMIYYAERNEFDNFNTYSDKAVQLSKTEAISAGLRSQFHRNRGNIFAHFLHDFTKAIEEYQIAMNIIREEISDKDRDPNQLLDLKIYIANSYMRLRQLDKALALLNPTSEDLSNIDRIICFQYYDCLGSIYQNKKMPFKSKEAHETALSYAEKDIQKYAIYNKIVRDFYLQKDYKKSIQKGLNYRKFFENYYRRGLYNNSIILSMSFIAINDAENAIFYAKNALSGISPYDLGNRSYCYGLLQKAYTLTKQHDSILKYSTLQKKINDSLHYANQKKLVDLYQEKLNEDNTSEKEEVLQVNASSKYSVYFILGSLSLAFSFIITILWYHKRKEKARVAFDWKEKRFGKYIENDQIHPLKESIATEDIKFNVSLGNEEYYDNLFLQKLEQKHPDLSNTDLKHCLYIIKKLSLKEISELLHVSVNTVKTGRYRAKSKLELKNGTSPKQYLKDIYFQMHQESIIVN